MDLTGEDPWGSDGPFLGPQRNNLDKRKEILFSVNSRWKHRRFVGSIDSIFPGEHSMLLDSARNLKEMLKRTVLAPLTDSCGSTVKSPLMGRVKNPLTGMGIAAR